MMEIKKGVSLLELTVVLVIAGIIIAIFIKSASKQIKNAELFASVKTADNIVSKICPAYLNSMLENNDWGNDQEIMENHDWSIEHLKNLYGFKLPKYWDNNAVLKYQKGYCILDFTLPAKNIIIPFLRSTAKIEHNSDSTHFVLYYPVMNYLDGGNVYYMTRFYKELANGNYYPGTFADIWEINGNQYTNIGTLLQYNSTVHNRNLNRIDSNNMNKADYNSLSYAGHPIPAGMKFIH